MMVANPMAPIARLVLLFRVFLVSKIGADSR